MNVYVKALVLFALICAPVVFLYTFYRRMSFEFPQTGSEKLASSCKLVANRDVVRILNNIENLDWEKMLIPIMPITQRSGACDVNIFRARINGNKTPVPGPEVTKSYIKYLDYVTTVHLPEARDAYSGAVKFVQQTLKFERVVGAETTPVVLSCVFIMLKDNGQRTRLQCFIPKIHNKVSICNGNSGKYFPGNDTVHKNHIMSNPMFNIDAHFKDYKYRYNRKWRDDGYAQCINDEESVFRSCNNDHADKNIVSVYNGMGKCTNVSKIKYICDREKYTKGKYYIKYSATEYIDCYKDVVVKCGAGYIYPDTAYNMNQCVRQDSADY